MKLFSRSKKSMDLQIPVTLKRRECVWKKKKINATAAGAVRNVV